MNLKTIITTNWNSFTLFSDGNIQFHLTPYKMITLIISAFICFTAALLYYRFRYNKIKQLFHRQKLARMILENGWYDVEGKVLAPIGCDYLYSELINPIFTKDGEQVKVSVSVKYLDNRTKAAQISQFDLTLEKDSNWKIVG